jgi:hypothetical protein
MKRENKSVCPRFWKMVQVSFSLHKQPRQLKPLVSQHIKFGEREKNIISNKLKKREMMDAANHSSALHLAAACKTQHQKGDIVDKRQEEQDHANANTVSKDESRTAQDLCNQCPSTIQQASRDALSHNNPAVLLDLRTLSAADRRHGCGKADSTHDVVPTENTRTTGTESYIHEPFADTQSSPSKRGRSRSSTSITDRVVKAPRKSSREVTTPGCYSKSSSRRTILVTTSSILTAPRSNIDFKSTPTSSILPTPPAWGTSSSLFRRTSSWHHGEHKKRRILARSRHCNAWPAWTIMSQHIGFISAFGAGNHDGMKRQNGGGKKPWMMNKETRLEYDTTRSLVSGSVTMAKPLCMRNKGTGSLKQDCWFEIFAKE